MELRKAMVKSGALRKKKKKKKPKSLSVSLDTMSLKEICSKRLSLWQKCWQLGGRGTRMVFQRIWGRHFRTKGGQWDTVSRKDCHREVLHQGRKVCVLTSRRVTWNQLRFETIKTCQNRGTILREGRQERPAPCSRLPSFCPFQEERRTTS